MIVVDSQSDIEVVMNTQRLHIIVIQTQLFNPRLSIGKTNTVSEHKTPLCNG